MGVMGCNRKGCDNIMCDRHSDKYGYICDECFDELVRQRIIYMNVDSFMSVKKVCDNNQGFDYDVYYDKLFSKFREDG